jgi:hypothetical protein
MSRLIAAIALAWLWTSASAADTATLVRTVDLDRAGALEALQQSNPVHYEKVRKIVDGVVHQPDTAVPRWMQASSGARDVEYAPVIMTSHPPQRRLSFALDDTRYVTVVRLTNVRGRVIPAR